MKILYPAILLIIISIQGFGQCICEAIQATGTEVTVSNVQELEAAIDQANIANGNMTIILLPGEYQLSSNLRFIGENMENLTIMGSTENKEDVMIRGLGWDNDLVTHIFNVAADNFTVANMTIGEVFYHPIQVHSNPSDADNFKAQNVRFIDAKEQLLKVSGGGDQYADNGIIQCCEFEFTDGIAYQFYTGGIDAHRSKDWEIKYNYFRGIRSPEYALAEHAIHMWRESSGTIVEANLIIDCDRGIGFGLGEGFENGHDGGIIMNNMVHTSRDVGIGLETSTNTKIYNNTVVTENYPRSIEYRFQGTTDALITNNLVNGEISDRSSGSTGTLSYNYTIADYERFEDAENYNYHLANDFINDPIVNAGIALEEVKMDFDCEERTTPSTSDIGADQVTIQVSTNDESLFFDIKIFPNPSKGTLTIEGEIENASIQIFNNFGQVIYEAKSDSKNLHIDLTERESGIYFIQITHGDITQNNKLVLTR